MYLSSARTNLSEHIFRQVEPQNLCYQLNDPLSSVVIALLPLEALLVEGVCVHLLPLCYPPVSLHTLFDLRHCYPCLHDMDYHPHALYLELGSALPLFTELPRPMGFSETHMQPCDLPRKTPVGSLVNRDNRAAPL